MQFLKTVWSAGRNWYKKTEPGPFLALAFLLSVAVALTVLWMLGIFNPTEPLPAAANTAGPGQALTDPTEIAALDAEFSDLAYFGYSADRVYCRHNLLSGQLEPGYGPLHRLRGYRLLIGKTGTVLEVVYRTTVDGEARLVAEPTADAELCLLLIADYTAPEAWWNRPVASAWCENGELNGQTFPELSMWAPWSEPFSAVSEGTERSACGWYWDGEAYVRFNRYTTLVVHDGRLDFAVYNQPSSP